MKRITEEQVDELIAEVGNAIADLQEAVREKDRHGSMDDIRWAAFESAEERLRRVEAKLAALQPARRR